MTNPHHHTPAPATARVSVVVPCYNQAPFLPARLASILGQIHAPAEIVVVDDASTDNTATRLAALSTRIPLRVHRNETRNGQPCAQWQTGVELTRHEWVWIAEADDASEPTFLATMLAAAERHPHADFIYCQSALTNAAGKALGTYTDFTDEIDTHRWRTDHTANGGDETRRFLSLRNIIPNIGACLVRRDAWLATVPLDVSLRLCGDWLAYARLLARTDIVFVAAPLNRFRTHDASVRASTSATEQIAEGYRVRSAIAALHGLDDGERELAARFAATEWLRLMPDAANLARERLPSHALAAAEVFDRDVVTRLREPALRDMPRVDLYHAAGRNFSEAQRSSQVVAPGAWRTLRLPAGPGALRFDPLNQPGRVELRRISVSEADTGRTIWLATRAEDFAALTVGGDAHIEHHHGRIKCGDGHIKCGEAPLTIVSTGSDPQIFFPVELSKASHLLEVETRITLAPMKRST